MLAGRAFQARCPATDKALSDTRSLTNPSPNPKEKRNYGRVMAEPTAFIGFYDRNDRRRMAEKSPVVVRIRANDKFLACNETVKGSRKMSVG